MRYKLKLFTFFFFLPSILVGLAFIPYYLLMVRSGENAKPREIASLLASPDRHCLYARATLMGASAKDFKPIHYKMYKPDIAIIEQHLIQNVANWVSG